MNKTYQLGVVGNPVAHSLSPQIHQLFAEQFDLAVDYKKYLQQPETLAGFVRDFFTQEGALGLNVTLPFKQAVMAVCQHVTPRAQSAQAVNTLVKTANGIVGDNTDGVGLLSDMQRMGWQLNKATVLMLGAGGAARGIAAALSDITGVRIALLNRTFDKIAPFQQDFPQLNWVNECQSPDIIINTCSQGGAELLRSYQVRLSSSLVYDISYGSRAQALLDFCRQQQAKQVADGLGMLVNQAAHAFQAWFGEMPDVDPVLQNMASQAS